MRDINYSKKLKKSIKNIIVFGKRKPQAIGGFALRLDEYKRKFGEFKYIQLDGSIKNIKKEILKVISNDSISTIVFCHWKTFRYTKLFLESFDQNSRVYKNVDILFDFIDGPSAKSIFSIKETFYLILKFLATLKITKITKFNNFNSKIWTTQKSFFNNLITSFTGIKVQVVYNQFQIDLDKFKPTSKLKGYTTVICNTTFKYNSNQLIKFLNCISRMRQDCISNNLFCIVLSGDYQQEMKSLIAEKYYFVEKILCNPSDKEIAENTNKFIVPWHHGQGICNRLNFALRCDRKVLCTESAIYSKELRNNKNIKAYNNYDDLEGILLLDD